MYDDPDKFTRKLEQKYVKEVQKSEFRNLPTTVTYVQKCSRKYFQ